MWRDPRGIGGTEIARPARWAHSIAVVVLSSIFIAGAGTFAAGVEVVLVVLASACALDLVRREARDPGSPLPIVVCVAILFTLAVILPPRFSHDVWSYAIVGRIVAVHHASPYLHAANAFPQDPILALVGPGWRSGTTPYGPLFTLHAASIALVAGSHPLLYRLAFQGAAAGAIAVALFVLWRTTRSTSALALLGLHPVVACSVVNGGHNDAFIGLGLLLAVVSARRERYGAAGWWIAAAVLVKATAGFALLPLVAWAWTRGRWRAAGRVAAAPLLVAVPVMLLTPGMIHSLNRASTDVITRASIWNLPLRLLPRLFPQEPHAPAVLLVKLALALVVVLVVGGAWIARRIRGPASGVVVAMAVWLLFGAYVLPWYTVWTLPTAAALGARTRLGRLVAVQGVAVIAVFVIPRASLPGRGLVNDIVQVVIPVALAAMFVWAVVPAVRRHDNLDAAMSLP